MSQERGLSCGEAVGVGIGVLAPFAVTLLMQNAEAGMWVVNGELGLLALYLFFAREKNA